MPICFIISKVRLWKQVQKVGLKINQLEVPKIYFYYSIDICKTISGGSTGKECVFPFKFNGKMYSYCIKSSDQKHKNKLWCPTMLNKKSSEMYSQTHWGWCSSKCPTKVTTLQGIISGKQSYSYFPERFCDCNFHHTVVSNRDKGIQNEPK